MSGMDLYYALVVVVGIAMDLWVKMKKKINKFQHLNVVAKSNRRISL